MLWMLQSLSVEARAAFPVSRDDESDALPLARQLEELASPQTRPIFGVYQWRRRSGRAFGRSNTGTPSCETPRWRSVSSPKISRFEDLKGLLEALESSEATPRLRRPWFRGGAVFAPSGARLLYPKLAMLKEALDLEKDASLAMEALRRHGDES